MYPTYEAWYALGILRTRQGRLDDAQRSFEGSLALVDNAPAWTALGNVHEMQNRDAPARNAYDRALRLDPNYVPGLHQAGRYWLEHGDPRRARGLLQRALELDPANALLQSDLRRARG